MNFRDPRVRAEARTAFALFLDPNVANDIVYGRVKLPSFVEFVNHVSLALHKSTFCLYLQQCNTNSLFYLQDTQHSRKNPFIDVERLIPVRFPSQGKVAFI